MILVLAACAPADSAGKDSVAETGSPVDSVPVDSGDSPVDSVDSSVDTVDSVDSAEPPGFTVTAFTDGLPAGAVYNSLSVAQDGTVWGATSLGLVHLDPATGDVHTYTSADNLYSDTPFAVLAASDGTLWVGEPGDTTRQGEQVRLEDDGSLSLLQPVAFVSNSEETTVFRIREQPFGDGAGDLWFGANEGLFVYDTSLAVFAQHLHPTHPHGNSMGIAFDPSDADVWNLDQYQLSRWDYDGDGTVSSTDNLVEYFTVWPVELEEDIYGADADEGADGVLWVASTEFGVARIEVGADAGTDVTTLLTAPSTAHAVRVGPDGTVWAGGVDGLYAWDGAAFEVVAPDGLPSGTVTQLAAGADRVWAAVDDELVELVGNPYE